MTKKRIKLQSGKIRMASFHWDIKLYSTLMEKRLKEIEDKIKNLESEAKEIIERIKELDLETEEDIIHDSIYIEKEYLMEKKEYLAEGINNLKDIKEEILINIKESENNEE